MTIPNAALAPRWFPPGCPDSYSPSAARSKCLSCCPDICKHFGIPLVQLLSFILIFTHNCMMRPPTNLPLPRWWLSLSCDIRRSCGRARLLFVCTITDQIPCNCILIHLEQLYTWTLPRTITPSLFIWNAWWGGKHPTYHWECVYI